MLAFRHSPVTCCRSPCATLGPSYCHSVLGSCQLSESWDSKPSHTFSCGWRVERGDEGLDARFPLPYSIGVQSVLFVFLA